MRRAPLTLAFWSVALGWLVCVGDAVRGAEQFRLQVPDDPAQDSTAVLDESALSITDAQGQRFLYQRQPAADSEDGGYLAFYSPQAQRFIRWPARGVGRMQIGSVMGDSINWRASLMQIRRVGGAPGNPAGAAAIEPEADGRGPLARGMHVTALQTGAGEQTVAHIDADGQLHFYAGSGEQWQHVAARIDPELLVPGAPLALLSAAGETLPTVCTVGATGQFLRIVDGQRAQRLPTASRFRPGSSFAPSHGNGVFIIDAEGRLWELDLAGGEHQCVEQRTDVLGPGSALASPTAGQVFAVDRRGHLIGYAQDPVAGWTGPELVGRGFVPGAPLAAWSLAAPAGLGSLGLAAVDQKGALRVLTGDGHQWKAKPVSKQRFPAGAPVATAIDAAGMHFSAVQPDGTWLEIVAGGDGVQERVIADGFPFPAPVIFGPQARTAIAVDIAGRLVASTLIGDEWRSALCVPDEGATFLPLARRKLELNRHLTPSSVEFFNPGPDELVIRLFDARFPDAVQEFALPSGGSKPVRVDRDEGGTLEERFLVPGPFGAPVERVRRIPLPPQRFYEAAVFANRVTYQYIDRRKKPGPLPNFDEKSLVSVGAFPLPPGAGLPEKARIDVLQAVQSGVP